MESGDLGAPSVAAKLVGRGGIGDDVDAALLGFGVKLRQRADAEGVIGGLLLAFHVQAVFENRLRSIAGRPSPAVADVPAQGLEERVDQVLADVGFLDAGGKERLSIGREVLA